MKQVHARLSEKALSLLMQHFAGGMPHTPFFVKEGKLYVTYNSIAITNNGGRIAVALMNNDEVLVSLDERVLVTGDILRLDGIQGDIVITKD